MTILDFRHVLKPHPLTETLFAEVNGHLADQKITPALGYARRCDDHRRAVLGEKRG
jgi:hypothetical protein